MMLGLVLGRVVEETLAASVIGSAAEAPPLFERPVAGVPGVVTIIAWTVAAPGSRPCAGAAEAARRSALLEGENRCMRQ